ncbi:MAG: peptide ABC transporter substrate-binding protein [Chloroflexota bacterium]
MKKNLYVLLSLLVLVSMVLAACGGGTEAPATEAPAGEATEAPATEAPAAEPKVATGAWSQEPDNIVPYYTQMSYAIWIVQLTLVGLAEWDDQGSFVPELAAEIPSAANGGVSADGLTITWKLKEGLKWSDGEALTSADVKFTWEQVMDPANAPLSRTGYDKIASVETPDDTTVVITFSELYPGWQTLFTQGPNNAGAILPKHVLEGKTALESDPFIHQPNVFSGPFAITEWVAGDHMILVRNDNFYGSPAILDQVNIKFVPTPETALAALQTGDVDWYPDFSESDIETVGALEPAVHLKVVPGADFEHYFFNLGTTAGVDGKGVADQDGFCPFKDIKVRKAITLGINRQAFVDSLLAGKTTVPVSQWPNSEWENKNLTPASYDPDGAAALLEEAGYVLGDDGIRHGDCNGTDTPLSFTFDTTDKQLRVDIALAVQSDLAKIGVEFKPNHSPAGTFFAGYTDGGIMPTGNYDMAGYTTGFYPDPMPGAIDSFSCNTVPSKDQPAGANNYLICDPQLDELMAAGNATADPATRKVAIDALQQYIFDNYYVVMMYARANVYGYGDRFVPGPFGFFSNMNWNAEVWDVK